MGAFTLAPRQYKFIKKDAAGAVTFEGGSDRSFPVPDAATSAFAGTWQQWTHRSRPSRERLVTRGTFSSPIADPSAARLMLTCAAMNVVRLAMLLAFASACSTSPDPVSSTELQTRELATTYTVAMSSDDSLVATAWFEKGSIDGSPVRLESSDSLVVHNNARSFALLGGPGPAFMYSATVSPSDGLAFTFRLSRTDGQHESTVTIPGPFSVRAVPVPDVVHRDGGTIVTWGNIQDADKVDVLITGPCILSYQQRVSGDATSHTVGRLVPAPGQEAASCDGKILVSASRAGAADPAFANLKVLGFRDRSVPINLRP